MAYTDSHTGRDSQPSTSLDDMFAHPLAPFSAPSFGAIPEDSPWMPLNHSPFVPMHPHPVMVHVDDQGHIVQLRSQSGTPAHISTIDSSESQPDQQKRTDATGDIVDSEVSSVPTNIGNTPRPAPVPPSEAPHPTININPFQRTVSRDLPIPNSNTRDRELPQIPNESPYASVIYQKRDSNPPAYTPTPEPRSPVEQRSLDPINPPGTEDPTIRHQQSFGYTYSSRSKEKPLVDDDFDRRRSAFQSIATYPELRPSTMATSAFPTHPNSKFPTPSLRVRNPEEYNTDADGEGIESALDANEFSEVGKTASRFGVRSVGKTGTRDGRSVTGRSGISIGRSGGPSEIIVRGDSLSSIDDEEDHTHEYIRRSRSPSPESPRFERERTPAPTHAPMAAYVENLGPDDETTFEASATPKQGRSPYQPEFAMPMPIPSVQPRTPSQAPNYFRSPSLTPRTHPAFPQPIRRGPITPTIKPLGRPSNLDTTTTPASDKSLISGSREIKPGVHVPVVNNLGGLSEAIAVAELVPGPPIEEKTPAVSLVGRTPMTRNRTPLLPVEMTPLQSVRTPIRLPDSLAPIPPAGFATEAEPDRPSFLNDMTALVQTIASIVDTHPEISHQWNNIMDQVRSRPRSLPGQRSEATPRTPSARTQQTPGSRLAPSIAPTSNVNEQFEDGDIEDAVNDLIEKLSSVMGPQPERAPHFGRIPKGMTSNPYETHQHALETRVKLEEARALYQAGQI